MIMTEYIHQEIFKELIQAIEKWKSLDPLFWNHEWTTKDTYLEINIWLKSDHQHFPLCIWLEGGDIVVDTSGGYPPQQKFIPLADPNWKSKVVDLVANFYQRIVLKYEDMIAYHEKKANQYKKCADKVTKMGEPEGLVRLRQ